MEDNRGTIFLAGIVAGIIAITGIFMYFGRPRATIIARGGEEKIQLTHESGNPVSWDGLLLSVTNGRDSEPMFRDPTSFPFGSDNQVLSKIYPRIEKNVEIPIYSPSTGGNLIVDNIYHVIIKHKPSGIVICDMNARVREQYD